MIDFLTFKTFISIDALIFFYALGAIVMPIAISFFTIWIIKKYNIIEKTYNQSKKLIWNSLNAKQKVQILSCFLICFFLMELFWRMLFEFLIAYMQIHDALVGLE
jgi:hypothetical protein